MASAPHPWRDWRRRRATLRLQDWLTASQTADYLCVSTRTVATWAKAGLLKRYPWSERYSRYRRADLDELLEYAKKSGLPVTYHLIRDHRDAQGQPDRRRREMESK